MSPTGKLLDILLLLLISVVHCSAQALDETQLPKIRQLSQGYGPTSYGAPASPLSPSVCRGRTGYVADINRNCQVFFNCLPDGTVTTSTCPGNYQFDENTQCCKMPHEVNCAGLLDGSQTGQTTVSCTGKRGFFSDYSSGCRRFFFCEPSGRSRQLSCPDGLIFNEQIGCCDIPQNVRCGNQPPQTPTYPSQPTADGRNSFCQTRGPGFFSNPADCSTYYFCQDGNSQFLRCPTGQAFNELSSSCDNDLSRCYGVRVDSSVGTQCLIQVFDCTGRNGWYQGNDPDCRRSFYCNAGVTYLHTCPGNLRWNPLSLSCDSPETVTCGATTRPSVVIRPPITAVTSGPAPGPPLYSYYNNYNYGGMTQSPISNIDAITQRLPWNGIGSTYPSVNVVTPQSGANGGTTTFYSSANSNPGLGIDNNYDCRGKIGYYAIIETGCSQFIYCNPEGIPNRFECPNTLLFNNSLAVCDWPQNVRCRNQVVPDFLPNTLNSPNFDCRGKDGFYADQNRGGRIFYMCHADGVKFQYVCPSNLVFNEQSAVCDWPDYLRQGGFTQRPQSEILQYVSVDWNNQPLDCRVRPAGYYANPTNRQAYARCTPDGTFVPQRCPQETIFDPVLGQCVFPFQVGSGSQRPPATPQTTENQNLGNGYFTGGYAPSGNSAYGGTFTGTYQNTRPLVTTQSSYGSIQQPAVQPNYPVQNVNSENNIQYSQGGEYGNQGPATPRPVFRPETTTVFNSNQFGNNENEIRYAVSGGAGGYGNNGIGNGGSRPVVTDAPFYPQQVVTAPAVTYNPYPPSGEQTFYQQGNQEGNSYGNNENGYGSRVDYVNQPMWGSGYYGVNQIQPPAVLTPESQQVLRPGISVDITFTGREDPRNAGQGGTPQGPDSRQVPTLCIGRSGMFADRTSGCSWYAMCTEDGSGEMRMCSGNLLFNENLGTCDVPQNVNCFTNVPGIVQPGVKVCMTGNTANTFVPDVTQSCMTFYSCEQNGRGTGFRCPTGMQFNTKINACDDPRNCNCVAGNGGTINVRIPVTTTVLDGSGQNVNTGGSYGSGESGNLASSYGSNFGAAPYAADYAASNIDQSMELEIPLSNSQQVYGRLPLVRGYDSSLYADTVATHGRLPSFYADEYVNYNGANFSENAQLAPSSSEDDPTAKKYIAPETPVSMLPVIDLKTTADNMTSKKSWLRDSRQRSYYKPQNKSLVFQTQNFSNLVQNLKFFQG